MRASALLLLPLLLGLVPGCGDGGGSALRVDGESFSFDGDLPAGLRIRRLEVGGRRDEVYDLEPVPGGHAGEYRARDAPDGVYLLEGPAGWWMLQEGGAAASLERGLQPPVLGLGRGRSLYVGPRVAEARPSDVWGAVRVLADGTEEPVPVTVEADERGYVVALRFAPEDWRGALQAVGRVATGPPPTPSPGPEAPLAEAFGFEARAVGEGYLQRAEAIQFPIPPTVRTWCKHCTTPSRWSLATRRRTARISTSRPGRRRLGRPREVVGRAVAPGPHHRARVRRTRRWPRPDRRIARGPG